ncbi:hypothetical protein K4F52_008101 [Lecanicillium sp. MT-2017a]|nr:hypothetical protein K4F52_008101 [Lecanicillium sp. MT-2017a]
MTMESTQFGHERALAELAVQRAAILTKRVMKSVTGVSKADASPVTAADFAAQALLISALHKALPNDRFLGEESADVLRNDDALRKQVWELVSATYLDDAESAALLATPESEEDMLKCIDLGGKETGGPSGRIWVMDPIDGTATFLQGKQYAVALALVVDGKEAVGVMGCPNLNPTASRVEETLVDNDGYGIMLSAVRGQGAVIRPIGTGALLPSRPIAKLAEFSGDMKDVNFVDSSLSEDYHLALARKVSSKIGVELPGTEAWSTHMRYAAQVLGKTGNYVQIRMPEENNDRDDCIWDYAGAQLLFKEVGGTVTDLRGKEIDFGAGRRLGSNFGVVCAVGGLHGQLLKAVGEVLSG